MKRITYTLDVQSIDAAIKELRSFQRWVEERLDVLCQRLAEVAKTEIAVGRGYTEGGEVEVYTLPVQNGYQVVAAGEAVFFLEYGTGTLAGTGEYLGVPPVSTHPGSYSDSMGAGTYSEWVNNGMVGVYKYTHAPRSGMYYGMKAAKESIMQIAKEVFAE